MNNYDLHERAQELADTHSAYELARVVAYYEGLAERTKSRHSASTTACDDQFAADPNEVGHG